MSNSQLPASMLDLASQLKASADANRPNSAQFMKFVKGDWLWGSEDTEAELDAEWVINPESFVHGWVAWGTKELGNPGKLVGEILVSITDPVTLESALPAVEGDWSRQVGFQMMCLSGVDDGVKVLFKSSSRGGLDLYSSVVSMVQKKIVSGGPEVAPGVLLASSSYVSKTYGKIHTPQVKYIKWLSLADLRELVGASDEVFDDESSEDQDTAPAKTSEVTEEPKTTRRGRAKTKETGSVFPDNDKQEQEQDEPPKQTRRRRRG